MKRIVLLLAPIAATLIGTSYLCAGPEPLDTKESKAVVQPAPPPECTWTGFYIGGFGGYAWGDLSFREQHETDPAYEFDQDSFIGGGEIGFNWQFGSRFVLGVEGTFAGGDFSDSASPKSIIIPSNAPAVKYLMLVKIGLVALLVAE